MTNDQNFDNIDNDATINQTQFSFEEPMRETGRPNFPEKKSVIDESNQSDKKNKKLPMFLLFAGIGLLLVVLGVAAIFMQPRQTNQVVTEQEEKPTSGKPVVRDPILTRLDNASVELKNADPAKQDLVFPPVNMNIQLDKEK